MSDSFERCWKATVFVTLFLIPEFGIGDFDEIRYDCGDVFEADDPKHVGNTLRRTERMAGRQLQMMLTKASRTLQVAVGTLSSMEVVE